VGIAQNRIEEKAHFMACADVSGVTCAPYAVIETPAQLQAVQDERADLLPGILKTARMGYDGKGQVRVKSAAELAGRVVSFAPQRNVHVDGILAVTHAYEGNMPPVLANSARDAAVSIAHHLCYVGVLCVEFFVVEDGSKHGGLVVNEMAPRPHNSGHYTLDACDVSQFDLQVRAMTSLPLPQPRQHSPAIMLNLLGDVWFDGNGGRREPDWHSVLSLPGTHLHLYGKLDARAGRKMGHLTITGPDVASVKTVARRAAGLLDLPGLDDI
jgi:5-(carboxyamino)imidazole ribonucleotide synthase